MMSLDDYLATVFGQDWAWGAMDCCFFGGDWVRARTGRDPLAPYRGRYDSAIGAARLIARHGGLVAMVGAEMQRCGFAPTSEPDDGDLAIVSMPGTGEMSIAGASVVICRGAWMLGKAAGHGVAGMRAAEPLAAWRIA